LARGIGSCNGQTGSTTSQSTTFDQLCRNLNLNWTKSFTLLVFEIDSELNHLNDNFEKRYLKVESLIIKWERRNLTTSDRVSMPRQYF
jgi:hypothetical protein